MAFDVATGRVKVGLVATDVSQDAEINLALNAALAFAEHYCDRNFIFKREQISKSFDRAGEAVFVNRYPIAKVHSATGAGGWTISHNSAGLIFNGGSRGGYGYGGAVYNSNRRVVIDYEGGYKSLPADLEYALWGIFGSLWPTYDPSIVAAGGGIAGPAIGAVKKRTIVGVGSIDYETGGSSGSSNAGSGTVAADLSAVMPGATQATLDMYKRVVA